MKAAGDGGNREVAGGASRSKEGMRRRDQTAVFYPQDPHVNNDPADAIDLLNADHCEAGRRRKKCATLTPYGKTAQKRKTVVQMYAARWISMQIEEAMF